MIALFTKLIVSPQPATSFDQNVLFYLNSCTLTAAPTSTSLQGDTHSTRTSATQSNQRAVSRSLCLNYHRRTMIYCRAYSPTKFNIDLIDDDVTILFVRSVTIARVSLLLLNEVHPGTNRRKTAEASSICSRRSYTNVNKRPQKSNSMHASGLGSTRSSLNLLLFEILTCHQKKFCR